MSQDITADALNELMNAKMAKKNSITVKRHSKLLVNILDIAKAAGYLDYSINGKEITINIIKLNKIKSIKPRYTVSVKRINDYRRRFLPAKNFGFLIISTNKGLMKCNEAEENNLGGCLIAYIY